MIGVEEEGGKIDEISPFLDPGYAVPPGCDRRDDRDRDIERVPDAGHQATAQVPVGRSSNQSGQPAARFWALASRSEEHTSELQSLMRNSYAVFCLKNNNRRTHPHYTIANQH